MSFSGQSFEIEDSADLDMSGGFASVLGPSSSQKSPSGFFGGGQTGGGGVDPDDPWAIDVLDAGKKKRRRRRRRRKEIQLQRSD